LGAATFGSSPAAAQCTAHEIAILGASTGAAFDQFGIAVAMDGDTIVVGSWLNTNSNGAAAGIAYVYQKDQGGVDNWGEVAVLVASNGVAQDAFGWSVAIDGDTVVIGAYRNDFLFENSGMAYVFERNAGGPDAWGETKVLTASDGARDDQFGWAVAVSGDTVAIGSHRADVDGLDDGAVYVYDRDLGGAGAWGERTRIDASDGLDGDLFGHGLSIDLDTLVVGAFLADNGGSNRGSAYVFERDLGGADAWGERTKIVASDAADDDYFGFAVGVNGDDAVVGAYQHDHGSTDGGGAYVFQRDEGGADTWGERMELFGADTSNNDWFGYSVSMDADSAVVGAYKDNGLAFESGAAYVFGRNYGGADNFGQSHKLLPLDGEIGDRFGYSVAVSGTSAASGAIFADPSGTNSGSAYAFDLAGLPVAYCTAGTSASGCQASISATGTPSASLPSGFSLVVTGAEGAKNGVFFMGINGRQANPWGSSSSRQCVVPPVRRLGLINGTGTAGLCDGTFTQDLNALWCPTCSTPQKNYGAGALVQAQLWYRDPLNTSNQSTSFSNALEFSVCP
jgi:hypothetical protein